MKKKKANVILWQQKTQDETMLVLQSWKIFGGE
jgi:hypothetical protein